MYYVLGDCRGFKGGNNTNKNNQGNCVGDCRPGQTDNIMGKKAARKTRRFFG